MATAADGDLARITTQPGDPPKGSNGLELLDRIGRAYVDFAFSHPEQLQVMFRPRHPESEGPPPPALTEISAKAFGHLNDAVRACQAQGLAPMGESAELALSAWSLVHGFATLWSQGQLGALVAVGDSVTEGEAFAQQRDRLLRTLQAGWQASAAAQAAEAKGSSKPPNV
jgi:hypothetical protein